VKHVFRTTDRDTNLVCLEYETLDCDVGSDNSVNDNDEYCEYTKAELKVHHFGGNVKVFLSGYRHEPILL
jgi:hypothetical protein